MSARRRAVAAALASALVAPAVASFGLLAPSAAAAFDLQAHRGGRGLAPENTLAAFRNALRIGVTTLETDLAVTRDGRLVLSHDPKLNPDIARGPDGRWLATPGPALHALTLDEVRRFDVGRLNPASRYAAQFPQQRASDGERIPTLDELAALVAAHPAPVRLNLETKITPTSADETPPPERFARVVVDAIRRHGLGARVTVQSFDWRTLVEVRRLAPEIETSCLTIVSAGMDTVTPGPDGGSPWHAGLRVADHGGSLPRLARAAGCSVWSMFWRNLAPEHVAQAREAGVKLLPWTVNEPADMARLAGLGVDGIITDYPDRLRRVMAERGLALPP